HAKAPALLIIGSAIWDEIGLLGQRMDVGLELAQRQPRPHRDRIVQHMQHVFTKVDHPRARAVLDIGVRDVPLIWNGPVQHRRAGWNLAALQRKHARDMVECFAYPVTSDRPANWKDLAGEAVELLADP